MNEQKHLNLLETLKITDGTMVTIDQILHDRVNIDEMVKNNLKIICLCKEGRGRSRFQSEALVKVNRPAIYLRDGIIGLIKLKQTSEEDFHQVVQRLSCIPVFVCYMTPDEIQEFNGSAEVLKEIINSLGANWRNRFLGGSSFVDEEKRRHYFPPAPSEITQAADEN